MQAGFATADITPPIGVTLNGFIARLGPSTSIDAPLFARALWLEDQQARGLIVALDVLGLSVEFADRLTAGVAERLRLAEQHVILCSTHTHSGPVTCPLRGIGTADDKYLAELEANIYAAAESAAGNKQPVDVYWGEAPVELGVNRRQIDPVDNKAVLGQNSSGPKDQAVHVLWLKGKSSSTVLYVHACHPYCLGAEYSLISPDFSGHAAAALAEHGHDSIYLNGCAGDIAPVRAFEGPEAAKAEGRRLADAVLRACDNARQEPAPRLSVHSVRFPIPYDEIPPIDALKQTLDTEDRTIRPEEKTNDVIRARVRAAGAAWLKDIEHATREAGSLFPQTARVSLVRIGGGAIVILTSEVFYRTGQKIAARLNASPAIIAGYGHAFLGYLPERDAFAFGGYEVDESHRYINLWRASPAAEDILQEQVDLLWSRA